MNNLSKKLTIILAIAILIVSGILIYMNFYQEKITFTLKGDKEISIYEGDIYQEPGFIAKDKNNNNINNRVLIESNLNNDIIGKYTITYSIKTKSKTISLERIINVLKDPIKNIEFNLKGNKIINLKLNEEFIDPLFTCIDKENNNNLNHLVKIDNLPDTKKVGTYDIKYTLKINDKEKVLTRTVNVLEDLYNVLISNN